MSFGPPKYMPGQIQSQSLAPMGFDETMAMLNATAPKNPIQAPKDRGMFGRFKGFNPLRFDPDKGVGEGNRLYALGAMLAGMGTGDPGLTASLLEPKLQQNRERVQARDEEARRRGMAAQLGVNEELFAMSPEAALAERRDARNFEYTKGRDTANDQYRDKVFNTQTGQWERDFQRQGDWRGEDQEYRAGRDAVTDAQWGAGFGLQKSQFELEKERAAAEAAAAVNPVPEFGDTWKMREAFEKRAQGFEEAQRQYFMMGDLAKDSTGASDIALGFAFFKTIDPTSTVREGEFAAAASSMGLNAALVQQFARLDKGEKFSPQLRQDLLQAAGHAYKQQAQDIEGLYERESEFASRMGADPSLIVRNPVRQTQGDGTVFKGGQTSAIPPAALDELLQDASPEAMREFDEVFGQGQAEQILRSQGRFPSRMTF